jgi:hypothetical protein
MPARETLSDVRRPILFRGPHMTKGNRKHLSRSNKIPNSRTRLGPFGITVMKWLAPTGRVRHLWRSPLQPLCERCEETPMRWTQRLRILSQFGRNFQINSNLVMDYRTTLETIRRKGGRKWV